MSKGGDLWAIFLFFFVFPYILGNRISTILGEIKFFPQQRDPLRPVKRCWNSSTGKNILPGKAVRLLSPDSYHPEKVITLNLNLPLSYPGVHCWALDQGSQSHCSPDCPLGTRRFPSSSSHALRPGSLSPANPTQDSPPGFPQDGPSLSILPLTVGCLCSVQYVFLPSPTRPWTPIASQALGSS